ncbi:hypothetical protein BCIN_02g08910 [Botrytis cinerea B05.10]|uniref:Uncharacterized protein n=1 Tax=Botryotinia fuckeliana (strain B05.10) TaxID=332648 RepID=A0A384JAR1_BOTFB|nr:hypothetical protein BCIN_02g08910 [Botrytis cinerea B05.10]ATZ47633.1 hypothetical protein BCIN_02g08910 [Botrytis cinerea B05.10]
MRVTLYQIIILSFGFMAIAAPLSHPDFSTIRSTDGDEFVRWPDNAIDENGLSVAAYQGD